MSKVKKRVGERYVTNEGYDLEIIECFGNQNCSVILSDGTILHNKEVGKIKDGEIKNPNHRSIFNVGYLGQGKYLAYSNKKITKPYRSWMAMFCRCYSESFLIEHPTYLECIVSKEWHNFQDFAEWFESNNVDGFHLDKDIIIKGNKVYGPDTCCFVPKEINNTFVKCNERRGNNPIGVTFRHNSFVAKIRMDKRHIYLGSFKTPELAFESYKQAKEDEIKRLAIKWRHSITDQCYKSLMNYKVEITD